MKLTHPYPAHGEGDSAVLWVILNTHGDDNSRGSWPSTSLTEEAGGSEGPGLSSHLVDHRLDRA